MFLGDRSDEEAGLEKTSLAEFLQKVRELDISTLEFTIAELSREVQFLEDQVGAQPELYREQSARERVEKKLNLHRKTLEIAKDEYRRKKMTKG